MIQSNKRRDLTAAFRSRALRCTPQRFAVFDYVARRPVHATAEEIFRGINRSDPRASRATVYNTLRALVHAGLLRESRVVGKAARFDAHPDGHHHFLCESCGRLENVAPPEWLRPPEPVALGGRTVRGYEIMFRGLCTECAGEKAGLEE